MRVFALELNNDIRGLEERKGSHHVGTGESERIHDRPIHMALSRKMDNPSYIISRDNLLNLFVITYIRLNKNIIRFILDILEICQIAGISELVEVYNPVVRILVDEEPDNVAADEPGATGYQYSPLECHNYFFIFPS